MKLFLMYVVGLAFCALAIYFADPVNHKSGACAFFGIGLLIPAVCGAFIEAVNGD